MLSFKLIRRERLAREKCKIRGQAGMPVAVPPIIADEFAGARDDGFLGSGLGGDEEGFDHGLEGFDADGLGHVLVHAGG